MDICASDATIVSKSNTAEDNDVKINRLVGHFPYIPIVNGLVSN